MRARADDRPVLHELASGGGPLVAVVHPGVFPATVYRRLAGELAGESDVVVLDLMGITQYWQAALQGGRPEIGIEDIADRFTAELGDRAAGAPAAVLVGWSFGGVIAYDMAQRWAAAWEPGRPRDGARDARDPMALDLLLLDSIAPTVEFPTDHPRATQVLLTWFAMYLSAKRGVALRLDEDRFAATPADDGIAIIRDALAERGAMAADTPVVGLRKLYDTFASGLIRNTQFTDVYRPQPTTRELTLLKPSRSMWELRPDLGWSVLAAGGLRILRCPGDHYTMLDDPAAVAAVAGLVRDKIRALLTSSVAGRPTGGR